MYRQYNCNTIEVNRSNKNKNRATRTPRRNRCAHRCSWRAKNSCSFQWHPSCNSCYKPNETHNNIQACTMHEHALCFHSCFTKYHRYYLLISDSLHSCKTRKSKTYSNTKYCHKYYDCNKGSVITTQMCRYPKLYSTQTNSCEDFKKVKCGSRKEYKTKCK